MRSLIFILAVHLSVHASEPPGYYSTAESNPNLRAALHQIVKNHRVIPYSSSSFDTSDALKVLDQAEDNTNHVFLIYSQRSEPKSTFGTTTGWNREHLWPNSYGLDDVEPSYSDLHNLYAADANVNSARGNKIFDESNPSDPNYRQSGHIEAPATSTDTDSWEPPDEQKGDIARAAFYMDVRYEGGLEPDLKLTDEIHLVSSTTNWMGRLTTFLKWHQLDPVSPRELIRNDTIYQLYQTNRNPFVDRPEWVRDVFWPRLSIVQTNNTSTVSWSRRYVGFSLQMTTNLTTWTSVTNRTTNGLMITVSLTNQASTTLFRLIAP